MPWESVWTEIDPTGRPVRRAADEPVKSRPSDPMLRKARRAALKRSVAAAKLAGVRHERTLAEIQSLAEKKDRFAAEHLASCSALREQICVIDKAAIEATLNNQPIDEKAETRRRKLLAEIHQAGLLLDKQHDEIDLQLARLHSERVELASSCHVPSIESELIELGNPEMLQRLRDAERGKLYNADVDEIRRQIIDE